MKNTRFNQGWPKTHPNVENSSHPRIRQFLRAIVTDNEMDHQLMSVISKMCIPIRTGLQQVRWFSAFLLPSDVAFGLDFYGGLHASRTPDMISMSCANLARGLDRTRCSISSHFDELRPQGICVIQPTATQTIAQRYPSGQAHG
jgi:hypothetical protein